jgi:hypothetical protein
MGLNCPFDCGLLFVPGDCDEVLPDAGCVVALVGFLEPNFEGDPIETEKQLLE